MVAELAGISAVATEQKSTSGSRRPRPRWIQTATREPIYSVLDSTESSVGSIPPGVKDNVVVISAVQKRDDSRESRVNEVEQRELPYIWLPLENKTTGSESPRIEVEDEHAIYSVVRKRVKEPEILTRQQELNKWLQTASEHLKRDTTGERPRGTSEIDLPGSSRAMFSNDMDEEWKRDRNLSSVPKGVIGLVGPYRIYPNPNERMEYMLQDEELVEETVDSVSDIAAVVSTEPHQRAKWRIREDDEETLVPDLPDPEDLKEEVTKVGKDPTTESWLHRELTDLTVGRENWKLRESDPLYKTTGILSGKEERAVDVPDGASSVTNDLNSKTANNEQQDKDSLNETGSTTGGAVEGTPGGTPSRGERTNNDPQVPVSSTLPPSKSLVSRILARARSPDDLLDHSEPFSQLWVVLSNVYGELVIVLMLALCLAEVMDTPVPLMSLQSVFLMYLYVGSIAVIISIYIWVLVDSCSSMGNGSTGVDDAELGGASLTRFGSLKRAHISRARTAPTSFYIRVGALLFGLATLVFNGLEMAMHSMMQGAECLSDVVFVHPVLHGLFTFLQMHFLFVNSQVLVERFGLAARFGFIHLAATNIAVWARLVVWDSAQEWTYFVHLAQRGPQTSSSPLNLRGFPGSLTRHTRDLLGETSTDQGLIRPYQPISSEQISQVVALQECLNTNTLGQLWTSSMPFLYPFIVQFSLIAAAVTFVMGQNVGRNRLCHKQKFHTSKDLTSHMRVGCDGSSKGLFLGILCMVAGIVVILIFLVVRDDENFPPETLSWLTCGTLIGILTLSGVMTASGLVQVRQMSVVTRAPAPLDSLLSNVALFGVQLYSIFTIVVSACSLATLDEETEDTQSRHVMLLSASVLQLIQCCAQSTLIAEASKRSCITRFQMMAKPARQVITFLLFSNAVLWAFDTVVTQNWLSQELQLRFFGVLAWGVICRIGLPLLVFYRFHSCVLLLEAWNKCYRVPRGELPLN